MSKFIDAVTAELTGNRYPVLEHMTIVQKWSDDATAFNSAMTYEYDIGVTWKVRTHCDKAALQHVTRNVLRQLREAVYGEFRDRVLRLERAVWEHDREKILMETRDLVREVME